MINLYRNLTNWLYVLMLLQMDAVCFPLEFIFLKKNIIQEFTSLMKHQFVVYIYKIYLLYIGDHNLLNCFKQWFFWSFSDYINAHRSPSKNLWFRHYWWRHQHNVTKPTNKVDVKLQVIVSIFVSNNFQLRMNFDSDADAF